MNSFMLINSKSYRKWIEFFKNQLIKINTFRNRKQGGSISVKGIKFLIKINSNT